jgi:phenylacetate-CoA ligase
MGASQLLRLGQAAVGGLIEWRRAERNRRLDPEQVRSLQEHKLARLVDHAWRTVPYYRKLFDGIGLEPGDVRSLDDLTRIPVTTKAALLAAGEEARLSSAFAREKLRRYTTSGTTGQPFTVYREPATTRRQTGRYTRALVAAGYRPGAPMLIVGDRARKKPVKQGWRLWRRVYTQDSPESVLAAYHAHRPAIVYGWVTPVRLLAELLRDAGGARHTPRAVVTTAESVDPPTRALIEGTFGCRVHEIYGSAELGTAAWQCRERDGFHVAEDAVVGEILPDPQGGAGSLVATNLERMAMPFIRYATADLATWGESAPCPCGCRFRRIARIEGRQVDILRLPGGRSLSPFILAMTMSHTPGVRRYQIVQDAVDRVRVRMEGNIAGELGDRVAAALAAELGDGVAVAIESVPSLEPPPGQKFRLVESRLGAPVP